MNALPALLGILLGLAGLWDLYRKRVSRGKALPPGPPPSLWGNEIPVLYSWRYFYNLSHTYGPLMTVWNGWTPIFVISSMQMYVQMAPCIRPCQARLTVSGHRHRADELLEKQAIHSADRPRLIVAGIIVIFAILSGAVTRASELCNPLFKRRNLLAQYENSSYWLQ